MRQPGIEPGPLPWKGRILTIRPLTLLSEAILPSIYSELHSLWMDRAIGNIETQSREFLCVFLIPTAKWIVWKDVAYSTFSEVDVSSIFIYPLVPRMVRINSMRQQEYYE